MVKTNWARLAGQHQYGSSHWLQFRLDWPWKSWTPGQFVLLYPAAGWDPYLPRAVLPLTYQEPFFTISLCPDSDPWLSDLSRFAAIGKRVHVTTPRGHGFSLPNDSHNLFLLARPSALPHLFTWLQPLSPRLSVLLWVEADNNSWQPPFAPAPAVEYQVYAPDQWQREVELDAALQWADATFMAGESTWFHDLAWQLAQRPWLATREIQVLLPDLLQHGLGLAEEERLPTERGTLSLVTDGPVFNFSHDYLRRRRK